MTPVQDATAAPDILVVGQRLSKIDYSTKGWRVTFCAARDDRQDEAEVYRVCALVRMCVAQGARGVAAVSRCVEMPARKPDEVASEAR